MSPSGLWLIALWPGMPQPAWPQKDVSETRDYGADFSRLMAPGAVILDVFPAFGSMIGGRIVSVDFLGTVAWFRLSGGSPSLTNSITLMVVLKDGQRISATIGLPIVKGLPSPQTANNPSVLSIGGRPISIGGRQMQSGASPEPIDIGGKTITIGGKTLTRGVS